MQQIIEYTRILPSLYQLGMTNAYAYLPEEGKAADIVREISALAIYERCGTFIYLCRSMEDRQQRLVTLMENFVRRPTVIFLDNQGDYAGHWKMQKWYVKEGRMAQTGLLRICGFRMLFPGLVKVEAAAEGIHIEQARFGKNEAEACKAAVLSWDGKLHFLVHAGQCFRREAQIRYELDGYDTLTRRWLPVVCEAENLWWDSESGGQDDTEIWAQAEVTWDNGGAVMFTFPERTVLHIADFPGIRMRELFFRFAKGTESSYLAPFGRGEFVENADVHIDGKGFFRVYNGSGVELAIRPEGYLGGRGLCAEIPLLQICASFYGAGIEKMTEASLPVLPMKEGEGRKRAGRLFDRKIREGSRLAYHRNAWFAERGFETCLRGREILWVNLYGTERKVPGIALCRPALELTQIVTTDEFFVLLSGQDRHLFAIPYTINAKRLKRAAETGYPERECSRLAAYYPAGQIFLGEDSFRQGVELAGCAYAPQLKGACHHFRMTAAGEEYRFAPDTWDEEGIFLLIKKGKRHSVRELAEAPILWDLWTKDKERERRLLEEICQDAEEVSGGEALVQRDWEGSMVIFDRKHPDGERRILLLHYLEAACSVLIIRQSPAPPAGK